MKRGEGDKFQNFKKIDISSQLATDLKIEDGNEGHERHDTAYNTPNAKLDIWNEESSLPYEYIQQVRS
jgi:hypothetical protein